jgi:hypothetical protein
MRQILNDLLENQGKLVYKQFQSIKNDISQNENIDKIIQKVNDLQLVFLLAQKQSKNKDDSEIYDILQKQLFELVFLIRRDDKDKINEYFNEILEVLKILVETNKEIQEIDTELQGIENYNIETELTDIKFGDNEVYRVK